MTEDDIISLGIQAESILRDDAFNDLFDFIVDDTTRMILATTLEQSKERENLYLTVQGMRNFTERLNQIVLTKENIILRRRNEAEDQEF